MKPKRTYTRAQYYEAKYYVKQYPQFVAEYRAAADISGVSYDGMPKAGEISDATAQKAAKRAALKKRIEPIETALNRIPKEYREGILKNAIYGTRFNTEFTHLNTWKLWKKRFFETVIIERQKQWLDLTTR